MESSRPFIIYIHGFNSSPASEKAQDFSYICKQKNTFDVAIPALSNDPEVALAQLEKLITDAGKKVYLLVGSSLGGYYATYLAEKYCCRAALVNPAVSPVKHLGQEFLGLHKNLYTGEEYEFTRAYADFLDTLDVEPLRHPENYLLLVQTGDEVLDYQLAVERYSKSLQVIQQGGSHRFEGFKNIVTALLEFARDGALSEKTLAEISTI